MIANMNQYFDHALLTPEIGHEDIARLCREAVEYDLYAVAINPYWVRYAKEQLGGSSVKILSVSGFPLSASTTAIKVAEAVRGVEDGADEIDMVANIGLLIEGNYITVRQEIAEVRHALPREIILKVIIEAPKLSPQTQVEAVKTVIDGGADFVKTATGFFGGATIDMVERLHRAAQGKIKVKASGGIRTLADTEALIKAGAERIGSSASVAIMNEYRLKYEM